MAASKEEAKAKFAASLTAEELAEILVEIIERNDDPSGAKEDLFDRTVCDSCKAEHGGQCPCEQLDCSYADRWAEIEKFIEIYKEKRNGRK